MLKKILVAVDHSTLSKETFAQALDLAKACQAQLMLVHVLTPVEEGYPEAPLTTEMMDDELNRTPDAVKAYIQQLDDFKGLCRDRPNFSHRTAVIHTVKDLERFKIKNLHL